MVKKPLSRVISEADLSQLKIYDPIQFPLATYFLNGKNDKPYAGEQWLGFESVSAVIKKITAELSHKEFPFILASSSLVSEICRIGSMKEVVETFVKFDNIIKELVEIALHCGALLILTSSYGHAEEFADIRLGTINRTPSNNPVPFVMVAKELEGKYPFSKGGPTPVIHDLSALPEIGTLSDVAPTILKLLGLNKPREMTGQALL